MKSRIGSGMAALFIAAAGCAASHDDVGANGSQDVTAVTDPVDVPLAGATAAETAQFNEGHDIFQHALQDGDGIGPVLSHQSCGGCHQIGGAGPGAIGKMAVLEADGVTPAADQKTLLPWGQTTRPLVAGGGRTPIAPVIAPNVKLTIRIGPNVLGFGYLEAIADSSIELQASEQAQRTDGIHGRVSHVAYASEPNTTTVFPTHAKGDIVIGRFGRKARVSTLDDFAADALQGDIGMTSPMRPNENPNPDGMTDDKKPGIDTTIANVNARAMYMRLTAIPARTANAVGAAAFVTAKCNVCHVSTMRTRPWPIAALSDVVAPVFTDFLLHDMGTDLADGVIENEAGPRDWRTSPLIGLRFERSYMHDGRAATIEDAVHLHGGPGSEAAVAATIVDQLDATTRQALFDYVKAL